MADFVALEALIHAVAGAISDAQEEVKKALVAHLNAYLDAGSPAPGGTRKARKDHVGLNGKRLECSNLIRRQDSRRDARKSRSEMSSISAIIAPENAGYFGHGGRKALGWLA